MGWFSKITKPFKKVIKSVAKETVRAGSGLNKISKTSRNQVINELERGIGTQAVKGIIGQLTGSTAAKQQRQLLADQQSQSQLAIDAGIRARARARKSEVFNQTEGMGAGMVGEVRSGISEEIDEEVGRTGKGKRGKLRI